MAEFCSTVSWCFRDRKAKDMILTLTLHTVCDGPVLQVFEFLFPLSRVDEKGETFMLHDHSRIFVLSFPAPVVFLPSWGPHSQCVVSKRARFTEYGWWSLPFYATRTAWWFAAPELKKTARGAKKASTESVWFCRRRFRLKNQACIEGRGWRTVV